MNCPDCNKSEGNCTCELKKHDSDRFRLNLYELAPRGLVIMSVLQPHPFDPSKQLVMFGVEVPEDCNVGAGSLVAFLPKELTNGKSR